MSATIDVSKFLDFFDSNAVLWLINLVFKHIRQNVPDSYVLYSWSGAGLHESMCKYGFTDTFWIEIGRYTSIFNWPRINSVCIKNVTLKNIANIGCQ